MYRYKEAEKIQKGTNFKLLYQYMGGTLNDYITYIVKGSAQQGPIESFLPMLNGETKHDENVIVDAWWRAVDILRDDAGMLLDQSINLGMDKPRALFSRAAVSILIGTPEEYERAVDLLTKAIISNEKLRKLEEQGVPVEDTISQENAYNQLGLAYLSLGKFTQSEENFIIAIDMKPQLWEAYVNLGSLYFEANRFKEAKEVLLTGMKMYKQSVEGPVHLSFMIQLGFAEELLKNYDSSLQYYENGLKLVEEYDSGGYTYDQNHVTKLRGNIERVRKLLHSK